MLDSGLYVVATPIGNLGDMVPRAIQILQSADLVAAEDTRHSAPLLRHFDIDTPMVSYHEHSDQRSLDKIRATIEKGGAVALISDAGTPLISDPGYKLVRYAHEAGWRVIPVPGASAIVAALSVAGLPTDRFRFEGFLPAKPGARRRRLEALAREPVTLGFYEAPHRVRECLSDMEDVFGGERLAVMARELTKTFETLWHEPLSALASRVAADDDQARGEIVLLVAGATEQETELTPEIEQLLYALGAELPPKKAAALVADAFGLRKKALYELLVSR